MLKAVLGAAAVADPMLRRCWASAIVAEKLPEARVSQLLVILEQWAREDETHQRLVPSTASVFDLARASMGAWGPTGLRSALGDGFGLCFGKDGTCTWAGGAALPDHEFRGASAAECGEVLDLPIDGLHDRASVDGLITRGLPMRGGAAYSCPLDGDRVLVVIQRTAAV